MTESTKQFNWDICGHHKIADFLQLSIINDQLVHAYLFVGPTHVGKQTVAEKFMASLYCQNQDEAVPCGQCSWCRQLEKKIHPDVYYVNRQINEKTGKWRKDIAVEQIRSLKIKLQQGTLLNSYKIALVPQAELINLSGFNALLKLIEEPTSKTIIILITDDLSKIPATVISRCQVLRFLPVGFKAIKEYLISHNYNQDIEKITALACGRPGTALSLAENQELLHSYNEAVKNFIDLAEADLPKRINMAENLISWSRDESANTDSLRLLLNHWQVALRDIMLVHYEQEFLITNQSFALALGKLKNKISLFKINFLIKKINQGLGYLAYGVSSKNILENIIIHF